MTEENIANNADWKRIRSVVEHENALINYRQTWLLSSQAFLLTAFGSLLVASTKDNSNEKLSVLLFIIPFLGIFIGFIIQRALNAAEDYLKELDQWWYFKLSISQDSHLNGDNSRDGDNNGSCKNWKAHTWHNEEERKDLIKKNIKEHPPLQGWTGDDSDRFLHYPVTPSLFILLWIVIFFLVVFNCKWIEDVFILGCHMFQYLCSQFDKEIPLH